MYTGPRFSARADVQAKRGRCTSGWDFALDSKCLQKLPEMGLKHPISATESLLYFNALEVPIPVHLNHTTPGPENPKP